MAKFKLQIFTPQSRGFTLIETLIALFILSLLMVGIWGMARLGFKAVGEAQARITASALANQQMETIRNLPYDSVGTAGGIPSGALAQVQTKNVNGVVYTIKTAVVYVDDPFDGTGVNDTNGIEADYKSVRVEVDWSGTFSSVKPVLFYTKITPKAIETAAGGGTIAVNVFNASARPVSAAAVHIQGVGLNPPIDLTLNTNAEGNLFLPGAPVCDGCYHISVTKAGYSTDRTYGADEVNTPLKPHLTVIKNQTTPASFSIDATAALALSTRRPAPPPDPPVALPNITFTLKGAKTIGQDANGAPVLKYTNTFTTDQGGIANITGLEWDSYTLTQNGAANQYDISQMNPFQPPMNIAPGAIFSENMILVPHADNTLLVSAADAAGHPQAGAGVQLAGPNSYSKTLAADVIGQAFFTPLASGGYTLTVTASGFEPFTGPLTISGNLNQAVTLNPL